MLTFFDGLLDVGSLLQEVDGVFPRRVQIGAEGYAVSATGGQIPSAFVALDGHDDIHAQRDFPKADETVIIGTDTKSVTHLWTLSGAWPQIKAGQLLFEPATGERYEVLMTSIHSMGLHTVLKTEANSQ